MAWEYETFGPDGQCKLFGVNIFDYDWQTTGKRVKVKDPIYHQDHMIAFSSFGGNTKDSISIEVCYIINTRPYDPYGYAKPDANTQPLFYSLRDNEIYLDIGNEEKIDIAFEVVCQWMDKILIPKMNELCATE